MLGFRKLSWETSKGHPLLKNNFEFKSSVYFYVILKNTENEWLSFESGFRCITLI